VKHFNHARNKEIIDSLLAKIAELEKERDELNGKFEEYFDAFMNCKCIPRNMEVHNLEQQAKGIESCVVELDRCYDVAVQEHGDFENAETLEYLIDCIRQLKGGAK
jgi:hypothetical protein